MLRPQGAIPPLPLSKNKLVCCPISHKNNSLPRSKIWSVALSHTSPENCTYSKLILSEIVMRCDGRLQIRTSRNTLLEICVQLVTVLDVTL